MPKLTPRTQAQQDWIVERRIRAIETGEFMEKAGLADLVGPPIGGNLKLGESIAELRARAGAESPQDLANRAARAGIYLPGQTSKLHESIIHSRRLEREHGVEVYAMPIKDRFGISTALDGFSAWEIPDLVEYDYSMANIAAASTIPGLTLGVVPGTNAGLIGSPDGLDPALAAGSVSRRVGTGSRKYFNILSCWVYTRTSAGAVYTAAAGTTMQPFVVSAAPASPTQISTALSAAALAINGLTNFWNQITLVAPADRVVQLASGTGAAAGIVAGFWGDFIASVLVVTAGLNIQGNSISMLWELA